jgi:hypothetical protein
MNANLKVTTHITSLHVNTIPNYFEQSNINHHHNDNNDNQSAGARCDGPGSLPLPPQPVFQAYFILYASRYRGPRIRALATLWSGVSQRF